MSPLRIVAVAFLVASTACSQKSPEEQLVKSVAPAASWVPTLQMVAEKWVANSVPSTFVGDSAGAALKEFDKAQQSLQSSEAQRDLRMRVRRDLQQGKDFALALQRAAGDDDPKAIAPAIRTLPPVKNDFEALRKQYGGGP